MDKIKLCDLCNCFIYSKSNEEQHKKGVLYFSKKLGYPDEGSEFEKKLGIIKHLFKVPIINKFIISKGLEHLQKQGYDALLLQLKEEVIGHTAYQIHNNDNSLHIFSVEINPNYRGQDLAKYMIINVLNEARYKKIEDVRLGAGNHPTINYIYEYLIKKKSEELGIFKSNKNNEKNWLKIEY